MNERDSWSELTRSVGDFLMPRRCPFCGALLGRQELLCPKCADTLPFTDGKAVRTGPFGRCASPLWYEGSVRDTIIRFKFKGEVSGLSCFGEMMARCAAQEFGGQFDAVTWVPISRKRLRKRRFDQSRYLTGAVCAEWQAAPVETLKKVVDNPPQSGITEAAARRANVLGVYEPVKGAAIAGKRWLLVDDIVTTGATLSECARVLREAGADEVVCLTLAATPER